MAIVERDKNRYIVRMPADLKASIEEAARAGKRSINAEIVARLEESFRANPMLSLVDAAAQTYVAVELAAADQQDDAEVQQVLARLRENITEALLTVARHRRDGQV